MSSLAFKDALLILRYRIIAVRYFGKLTRALRKPATLLPTGRSAETKQARSVQSIGFAEGPAMDPTLLEEIVEKYAPRAEQVVPRDRGHPFQNLWAAEDIDAGDPVFRWALSDAVLPIVDDFFGGRFMFETIQVLYSYPTQGLLRESQKWHKDYGDSRSLHLISYLNDLEDKEGGPFVFVDRATTKQVSASPIIRRIEDDQFAQETAGAQVHEFYGKAGSTLVVDPANCYHYGSRCERPRLALFC